ncbi:MAG: CoA-binding protein [Candidatus Rokubacteria bacterium]|nr:CoA-binding protein [Candidatus Rokubacteria bacterium]
MTASGRPADALHALFAPRAIAVVGASDDPAKIGGRPLAFLLRHGYPGRIYPVNPGRPAVQGIPAFPTVGAVPDAVDLAIVVVPAERVVETLEACAAKGVRAAIVFSSGFAETGEAGRAEQARMRAVAERTGLRVVGPNCQGFAHLPSRVMAAFASGFLDDTLATGPIAVVSQSGAMAGMVYEMAKAAGLGINYWVSTGNEADVQAAEILGVAVEDPETRVALAYLEDVKDAARLRETLGRAHRRGVPVFVLKSGRSAEGQPAAASHTGALAGEDQVYGGMPAGAGGDRRGRRRGSRPSRGRRRRPPDGQGRRRELPAALRGGTHGSRRGGAGARGRGGRDRSEPGAGARAW